jgi:NADPH-dependent ferric siderophore reductase
VRVGRERPAERVAEHHRDGVGNRRIGYPIEVRRQRLVAREEVTPRMVRLTLGGPELAGLHTYQADDHVAVVFPDPDGELRVPVPNDHQMLDWPRPAPPTRKYTIRRYDAAALELDLDVVLHDGGLASTWATDAALGDEVVVAGPPGALAFPHTYDHYVLAVDPTGLPAVARWLEEADRSVPGVVARVVVVVDEPEERGYPLPQPEGVSVTWLPRESPSSLAAAVESLDLPEGRGFLFAAGEAGELKLLRRWAKGRCDHLVTGYWKRGVAGLDG